MKLSKSMKDKLDLVIFWSCAIIQVVVLAFAYSAVVLVILILLGLFMGVIAA